jgi:tRNA(fMet)-specific endonuclease VapC
MKILDTDLLAAILRKNEGAFKRFGQIKSENALFTTVFNVQELLFGALLSENFEKNFKASKELVDSLQVLVYDKDSMQESVKVQVHLEKRGLHIGLLDEMIAGICLKHNATIVTRNVNHFSKIPNIKIEKW